MSETVRFIRKNGRIIPIRTGKNKKEDYKREAKLLGGSLATGYASQVGLGMQVGHNQNTKNYVKMDEFKKTYADPIKKSGNPKFMEIKPKGPFDIRARFRRGVRVETSTAAGQLPKFRTFKINQIEFTPLMKTEDTLLHELGHARSSKRRFSMNSFYAKTKSKFTKYPPISHFTNLISEAEATGEAVRMASKAKGWKHGAKIGAKLIPAYGTYLAPAGVSTAVILAGLKFMRNRKKDR